LLGIAVFGLAFGLLIAALSAAQRSGYGFPTRGKVE